MFKGDQTGNSTTYYMSCENVAAHVERDEEQKKSDNEKIPRKPDVVV